MKGRNDQSLSAAGSLPSSTPNQLSISGPLLEISDRINRCWGCSPCMMEVHHAHEGREAAFGGHGRSLTYVTVLILTETVRYLDQSPEGERVVT